MTTRADLNPGKVDVPNREHHDREVQDLELVKMLNKIVTRMNHLQGIVHERFCTKKKCICFEPPYFEDYLLTRYKNDGTPAPEVKKDIDDVPNLVSFLIAIGFGVVGFIIGQLIISCS